MDENQRLVVQLSSWVRVLKFSSVIAILGVVTVGASLILGVTAKSRYFDQVAEIIPVLTLALTIEQQFFFQVRPGRFPVGKEERGFFVALEAGLNAFGDLSTKGIYALQGILLTLLVAGEIAALAVVATDNPTTLGFALATAGLTVSAAALVFSLVARTLTATEVAKIEEEHKREEREAAAAAKGAAAAARSST